MKLSNFQSRLRMSLLAGVALALIGAEAGPQISNGIRFSLTPHGLGYFKKNLEEVLKRNGRDLSKLRISKSTIELDDPFNTDELSDQAREKQKDQIAEVSKRLSNYFRGFDFSHPNFKFTLSNFGYEAKFKSLGIEIDPNGLKNYRLKKGVVALMRFESTNFCFDLPEFRAVDLKNPQILGTIGMDGFWASHIAGGCEKRRSLRNASQRTPQVIGDTRPLKIEIPIHIDTDEKGLTIEAITIRSNLQLVGLLADFNKMLLPNLSIKINGVDYPFDKRAFEADVKSMMSSLLPVVITGVKNYFEQSGKEVLKEELDALAKEGNLSFKTILPEAPVGSEKVNLALRATSADYVGGRFQIIFNTDIQDPSLNGGQGVFSAVGSASAPTYASAPTRAHDVALVIHPAIINGLLQRTFDHGFLSETEISDGEKVKITKAPVFSFAPSVNNNLGKLHVAIAYEVNGGVEDMIVRKPIPIEFDLHFRLETLNKNEVDIVVEKIDLESLQVTTNDVTVLGLFQKKIKKKVIERLAAQNAAYLEKRYTLGSIPALEDVMGVPTRLVDAKTDQGSVVLYSSFDDH